MSSWKVILKSEVKGHDKENMPDVHNPIFSTSIIRDLQNLQICKWIFSNCMKPIGPLKIISFTKKSKKFLIIHETSESKCIQSEKYSKSNIFLLYLLRNYFSKALVHSWTHPACTKHYWSLYLTHYTKNDVCRSGGQYSVIKHNDPKERVRTDSACKW